MPAPMPSIVVLIVCKTVLAGPVDQNADKTGWENRQWDYTHSVMHCKREVIDVYDPAVDQGAAPQPYSEQICNRTGALLGPMYDAQHKNSPWRYFKNACPTPIRKGPSEHDEVVDWLIPDCGTVNGVKIVCDKDSVI